MAGLTEDSSAELATRMAVPVWKLPQRSRRVEGRLWVESTRSLMLSAGRSQLQLSSDRCTAVSGHISVDTRTSALADQATFTIAN